ncbi:MAG: transaldolase, partial [Verrucomicrobia bacterium]|nr:transaldolase [Verrucomicrobiota bacterium]
LAIKDVQMAADVLRPLYVGSLGDHGYVSLEVNPHLARDTQGTVEDARRLWSRVNRPNIFIKVPGTKEGLPAITQLISEGINVNVTLLFSVPRYGEVADAYLSGIEQRLNDGQPVDQARSVASFFLSRIDVLLDDRLEAIIAKGGHKASLARELRGEVAIASAKEAYQLYLEILAGERWKKLASKGAQAQRLLWASTSTKNPDDSDVKYVEPLIGPYTINTLPRKTLQAYQDHGSPQPRLQEDIERARRVLDQLSQLGLDLDEVARQLEEEGLKKFCEPFDALLTTLEEEMATASSG